MEQHHSPSPEASVTHCWVKLWVENKMGTGLWRRRQWRLKAGKTALGGDGWQQCWFLWPSETKEGLLSVLLQEAEGYTEEGSRRLGDRPGLWCFSRILTEHISVKVRGAINFSLLWIAGAKLHCRPLLVAKVIAVSWVGRTISPLACFPLESQRWPAASWVAGRAVEWGGWADMPAGCCWRGSTVSFPSPGCVFSLLLLCHLVFLWPFSEPNQFIKPLAN